MKKRITMQDIADALGVSRVTVWKAFHNQAGVSDALSGQILHKAREMGYHRQAAPSSAEESSGHEAGEMTISVIVSRPESSLFWMSIIHRIAKELAKRRINLLYTYVPSRYTEDYRFPQALEDETVQGAIVLNVYDEAMLRRINGLHIPKVFYDTVTAVPTFALEGDVVLLEGREKIRRITNALIRSGYRDIGFIGDVQYARTNADRYEGFLQALDENGIAPKSGQCLTGPIEVGDYYGVISTFMQGLPRLPQAMVCVSDYVAHFLHRYLTEHGYSVPGDIAISGYDGTTEYGNVDGLLTTVAVKTPELGRRLVRQLLMRIESPSMPYELIYINPTIVFNDSTGAAGANAAD